MPCTKIPEIQQQFPLVHLGALREDREDQRLKLLRVEKTEHSEVVLKKRRNKPEIFKWICNICKKEFSAPKDHGRDRVSCCIRGTPYERFIRKVDKNNSNGCWIWKSALTPFGYGKFILGKEQQAHRVGWILLRGPIPAGMFVLHKCPNKHNRACVNPDHLYIGTAKNNVDDARAQGTLTAPKGEQSHFHVLTGSQVVKIRSEWIPHQVTQIHLANKYQVSLPTIARVLRRVSWKHI